MNRPLISIVMPTKNSEKTLELCLASIKDQTYKNYEVIIVDGFSNDSTLRIAEKYSSKISSSNAGMSEARNLGFSRARGEIFLSIDSDMILERSMLEEIAGEMDGNGGLIIPEIGYGADFISKCKDLEKRCYLGDDSIESARAFSREAFEINRGYDANLLFGEDRDLHLRIKQGFKISRIESKVSHNTQNSSLISHFKKAYLYGKTLPQYISKSDLHKKDWKRRNPFFVKNTSIFIKEPIFAIGLSFIKTMEYIFGFIGFFVGKIRRK